MYGQNKKNHITEEPRISLHRTASDHYNSAKVAQSPVCTMRMQFITYRVSLITV